MENNLEDDTKTLENQANICGESNMVMCTELEFKISVIPLFFKIFLPF